MNYLVIYDVPIEYDRIRTKIALMCKNYGLFRIQLSVFWGTLTQNLLRELTIRINDLIQNIPEDIRFIAVCSKCFQKSFAILNNFAIQTKGVVKLQDHPLFSIVSHTDVGWNASDLERKAERERKRNLKKKKKTSIKNQERIEISPEKIKTFPDLENMTFEEMVEFTGADLSLSPPMPNLKLPDFDKIKKKNGEISTLKVQEPKKIKKSIKTDQNQAKKENFQSIDKNYSEETKEDKNNLTEELQILKGKTCSFDAWNSKKSFISPQFLTVEEKYDIADKTFKEESEESEESEISENQFNIQEGIQEKTQAKIQDEIIDKMHDKIQNEEKMQDKILYEGKILNKKTVKKKEIYRGMVDLDVLLI